MTDWWWALEELHRLAGMLGLHSQQPEDQLLSPSAAACLLLTYTFTTSTALALLITQRISGPFALETAWSQLRDKWERTWKGGHIVLMWAGWNQATTSSKSSFWWSSRNLVKVLMGLMAFKVMAASLAHSRFGPNTTARLVFVILFLSLWAETYVGRKDTIVTPTEQHNSCPLPSPKPEMTNSEGQMGGEKLNARRQRREALRRWGAVSCSLLL